MKFRYSNRVNRTINPIVDFNNNGWVDVGDAARISFYLAGKVDEQ